jgi:AcrR family transcriptional regulator
MASRKELKKQKEKTSQALIDAALELCAKEGYASLSLRSVARKAGIAPTSFYRHFREIDEMGVEMAAQAKAVLEDCLIRALGKMSFSAGKKSNDSELLIKTVAKNTRPFAETFISCFNKNPLLLHFFFQERTGNSESVRTAIDEAWKHLTGLMEKNLEKFADAAKTEFTDLPLISDIVLSHLSDCARQTMVHPASKPADVAADAANRLNLVLMGAIAVGRQMKNPIQKKAQGDAND